MSFLFFSYINILCSYTQPTKIDPLSVGGRVRKQADEPVQPRMTLFFFAPIILRKKTLFFS